MMVSLSIVLSNDVDRYILRLYLNDLVVLSLSVGLDKKIRKVFSFFFLDSKPKTRNNLYQFSEENKYANHFPLNTFVKRKMKYVQ